MRGIGSGDPSSGSNGTGGIIHIPWYQTNQTVFTSEYACITLM